MKKHNIKEKAKTAGKVTATGATALLIAIGNYIDESEKHKKELEKQNEERRAEMEEAFSEAAINNCYTRGTVIAAMAEKRWSSWDMNRVLGTIDTPEKAEAAVGLIKAGYDSWNICRVIQNL